MKNLIFRKTTYDRRRDRITSSFHGLKVAKNGRLKNSKLYEPFRRIKEDKGKHGKSTIKYQRNIRKTQEEECNKKAK